MSKQNTEKAGLYSNLPTVSAGVALFLTFVIIGWAAPHLAVPVNGRVAVSVCGTTNAGAITSHTYNGSFETQAEITEIEIDYSDSAVYSVHPDDVSGTLNNSQVSLSSMKANQLERSLTMELNRPMPVNYSDNFSLKVKNVIHPKNTQSTQLTIRFKNSTGTVDTVLFAMTYPTLNQTIHRPVSARSGTYQASTEKKTVFGLAIPGTGHKSQRINDTLNIRPSDKRPVIEYDIQSQDAQEAIKEAISDESDSAWEPELIGSVNGKSAAVYVGSPTTYATENLESFIVISSDAKKAYVYYTGDQASVKSLSLDVQLQSGTLEQLRAYGLDIYLSDEGPEKSNDDGY